jgi:hypothetical protein
MVRIEEGPHSIEVTIRDNGEGMDSRQLRRAGDPFSGSGKKHLRRKFGLGLPLLMQTVEQAEGDFSIASTPGRGTRVCFRFPRRHLDTPPIGNIPETVLQTMLFDAGYECEVKRSYTAPDNASEYTIRSKELKEVLGDLSSSENISLAKRYIASREEECKGGEENGKNEIG